MNKTLTLLILTLSSLAAWAQAPTVTTDTRYARGATKAFGRMTAVSNGQSTVARGFCFSSENPEPTIDDSLTQRTFINNGMIYIMEGLTPATKYYARAYAKAQDGSVGYGDVLTFYTLPMGNISSSWDNGGPSDEVNERIQQAITDMVDYWNNLTCIDGLYLSVHYGADTPTADCSYGGWMRIGPLESYQRTGTVMHEALHAVGVGTCDLWYGSSSPLRAGSGTGQWLGQRATELVQFWGNDTTAILNGDATHLWPYGINGAHEDDGTEMLYTANSLVAQALGEDGLPWTTAYPSGAPYYSFQHQDDTKYYIKSESEDHGLYSSFLVENANHKLVWSTLTAEEAQQTDAAAWYITFSPTKQLYQLRNASTGYYITYSATGTNGITTSDVTTTTSLQDFQLMPSRSTILTGMRGYWMIHPGSASESAQCLTAASSTATSATTFNIADASSQQRWLILTAEEVTTFDDAAAILASAEFAETKEWAETILAHPHQEVTEGADATLQSTLNEISESVTITTAAGTISDYTAQIVTAVKTFLGQVMVSDINNPFDLTSLLVNPDFATDMSGWTLGDGSAYGYSSVESYVQTSASATQTISSMPKGTYTLRVQAFQRPGSNDDVYTAYTSGTSNVTVGIWINSTQLGRTVIKNVMDERTATSLHSGDHALTDGTYVPNTMASARAHFDAGYYDNEVTSYVSSAGDLRVYLRGSNSTSSSWTIFDNFRLYYYGPLTMDEITAVENVQEQGPVTANGRIYNVNGQCVGTSLQQLPAGIYIVDGKKVVVR